MFTISCESTVDLTYEEIRARGIPVLTYQYTMDGQEYPDDMGRTPGALEHFYSRLREGATARTSQLNQAQYLEFFESLPETANILHIAFTSGQSGAVNNAFLAAEEFRTNHPERRIEVIDSLCSSSGYGMLVLEAVRKRDEGADLEECIACINGLRTRIHHCFFSTDLSFYRRSGRISGPTATIGKILNLCPLMRISHDGRIYAYGKVRGKKNAIREIINEMQTHALPDYAGPCFICHSDCPDTAEQVREEVLRQFPALKREDIRIYPIGTVIASHCGPGTAAVFFIGDERE